MKDDENERMFIAWEKLMRDGDPKPPEWAEDVVVRSWVPEKDYEDAMLGAFCLVAAIVVAWAIGLAMIGEIPTPLIP
jgi:hypothetical protein